MPTFQELQAAADDRVLVRKVLRAVAFLAPTSVELPEALTDESSQPIDLQEQGYLPVGIVNPDGWRFTREIEKEDIDALGYASPVRSDITRVPRQVTFTALQTGVKHMNELIYGTDLTGVAPGANGEIVFDEPDLPIGAEYRLVVIGDDGPATEEWILGRGYWRTKVSATAEQAWAKEGALQQEVTLDVFADDETGATVRHYLGGTGASMHADVLGYTDAVGSKAAAKAPAKSPAITTGKE